MDGEYQVLNIKERAVEAATVAKSSELNIFLVPRFSLLPDEDVPFTPVFVGAKSCI